MISSPKIFDASEKLMVILLLVITGFVVIISTYEWVVVIIQSVIRTENEVEPTLLLKPGELHNVFIFILLIVIGLGLFEAIKHYLGSHILRAEIVLIVALTGIARKIILLDYEKNNGALLIGIALPFIALPASYFFIKKTYATCGVNPPASGKL